ncbi:MAG: SO_0444 family Cu/Zn efflux transporter [Spirochaetes bacterium]|jgi:uncharacterized membrane protein YraQ (UPF0718 family)|nr:SO_0444 family Cu/Zn efflux transporter [Spirochaetota bacterium]
MIMEFLKHALGFMLDISPYMVLGLIFVGLLHVFVSKEYVARHIGHPGVFSAIKATLLGVPLPLCSCGVIPTAVYFTRSGASKGAVIAFLISTPQTGVDSIIATYGMLGPVFAVFRPLAAFVSGIFGGIIASFGDKEKLVTVQKMDSLDIACTSDTCDTVAPNSKVRQFYNYAFVEFLDDIVLQFILGVIIAALISYFIPGDFFLRYGLATGISGMVMMIIIGIPMYVCATASIPIALALISKGVSPGAVFVFLAVGPMTNAASLTVLYRVLKTRMMAIYLGSGVLFAVIFGYLLDLIVLQTGLAVLPIGIREQKGEEGPSWFVIVLTVLFSSQLIFLLIRKVFRKYFKEE